MTQQRVANDVVSIVVRGSFNAAIFSPTWFRDQELIGPEELESAEIEIITQDFARFEMKWLGFQADRNGIQLTTDKPEEFERLRDATSGILQTLRHTPVAALGINRAFHMAIDSPERWHQIGDVLAPKNVWADEFDPAGMRSITIWGHRGDGRGGRSQVQVEPSFVVPTAVYIACNEHFTLESAPVEATRDDAWSISEQEVEASPKKIEAALEVLSAAWVPSLDRAERMLAIVDGIRADA